MPEVDPKWQPHYQPRVCQANYLSIPELKTFFPNVYLEICPALSFVDEPLYTEMDKNWTM
jgi:hypothetical protein